MDERLKIFLSSYSRGRPSYLQYSVETSVQSSFRLQLNKKTTNSQGKHMNLSMSIGPIVALIAGILILLMPRLLNYIVAVYLIVIGLIGLFGTGSLRI